NVQDKYPEFAKHVFAISAVSGGSLGSAAFAALVNYAERVAGPTDTEWYSTQARGFLKKDFLSQVLAAALFLDLPAQVLPCGGDWFCPGGRLGRERALERSLEAAWSSVFPSDQNPFTASVEQLWRPGKYTPALLLNTTEVETGARVVVSPWSLESPANPGLY